MERPISNLESAGNEGPMAVSNQGHVVLITAMITYPGSKITDIMIGNTKVQVPNEDLRAAYLEADEATDAMGGG